MNTKEMFKKMLEELTEMVNNLEEVDEEEQIEEEKDQEQKDQEQYVKEAKEIINFLDKKNITPHRFCCIAFSIMAKNYKDSGYDYFDFVSDVKYHTGKLKCVWEEKE